jgi:hypothetical protein
MKDEFMYAQNGNLVQKYNSFEEFKKEYQTVTHEDALELVTRIHGYSILIFKNNDDNVEIVCPLNRMNKQKQCILLYYFDYANCYEPIIKKPAQRHDVEFVFDVQDPLLKDGIQTVLNTYEQCRATIDYSLEDGYTPKHNILSNILYDKLYDKYLNIQQVTQYNKCIGFVVDEYYIPCYPSEIIRDIQQVKAPPVHALDKIISFLKEISDTLQVPCLARYKVINSFNKITGILTETFHYVPCIHRKNDRTIKLESYYGDFQHEFIEVTKEESDMKRVMNTQHIQYEQYGYNYCKQSLMIALNQHMFVNQRKKIKSIVQNDDSYTEKISEINKIIHEVLGIFLKDKIEWVDKITDVFIQDSIENCPNGFCNLKDKLYLPKINLVTKEYNDYYKRLADELIRNKQVELFVLKPEVQFFVPYKGQENEIILDINIIENYLSNLGKPLKTKKYYDNAKISQIHLMFNVIKVGTIQITE